MGKNLKGKEIGKGIRQRKDGRYEARITIKGSGKPPFSIYGTNLPASEKAKKHVFSGGSPRCSRL